MAYKSKLTLLERLLSKVEVQPNGCWCFTGALNSGKYGVINVDGSMQYAHRVSFIEHGGTIPIDKPILDHICHDPKVCPGGKLCLHRRCVNPDHLEPSTYSENLSVERRDCSVATQKATEARKAKTCCPQGHAYDEANTKIRKSKNGSIARRCRTCDRDYQKQRKQVAI